MAKIKNTGNIITYLKDGNEIISDSDRLAEHTMNFFTNIFCVAGTF